MKCGCKNTNHAITRSQRAYCLRSMTIARETRDLAAYARIHEAMYEPCPTRDPGLASLNCAGWGDVAKRILSSAN